MFAKLHSLGLLALDGFAVTIEVDISGGLPQFSIVGLPDNAVKESCERVRSALKNMGYEYPSSRITVNLAPADVRKTGPVYDLPILLGLLCASGQLSAPPPDCAFIGEISLNGEVRAVRSVLPMALACGENGINHLFLPAENAPEAAVAENLCVYPVHTVSQLLEHLSDKKPIKPQLATDLTSGISGGSMLNFSDVHGQLEARRAMEIAAAGAHNVILVGSPGTGKSMLAKRLPGILAPMSRSEAIETSKIYSVASHKQNPELAGLLIKNRPFRSPHHSSTPAGMIGGGTPLRPGEVSFAHEGVLFLDELPEFRREVLEMLRQPLEDGYVTLSRASFTVRYPSRFMLVAAMNPCPCGYFGHPTRECRCVDTAIDRYLRRISGPLLDRIDLHVEVPPLDYSAISSSTGGEGSSAIAQRVQAARKFQAQRSGQNPPIANSALQGERLRHECPLTDKASAVLKMAFERLGLSARGHDRVLRVSRTIADLAASEVIDVIHVSEAVQYRNLDRKYWHNI